MTTRLQKRSMNTVDRQQLNIDRTKLSLLTCGPELAPPLVLLHGIPAGAELWRDVLPHLAEAGYRCYAPDLPGYGQTRLPPDGDYSLGGGAKLIAQWLEQEGMGPVWLVGHDLGGGVAEIMTVESPELISRLTLGDTVIADSWPVRPIKIMRALAQARLFGPVARLGLMKNPYTDWELNRALARPTKIDKAARTRVFWDEKFSDPEGVRQFSRHLRALNNEQTAAVADRLRDIQVPVLLLWAAADRFQPYETVGRRLAEHLPQPEHRSIADAGHFLPLEKPQEYAEALIAWAGKGGD